MDLTSDSTDSSGSNLIYNNIFNNTVNLLNNTQGYPGYGFDDAVWNTTKTSGTNIIGGPYIGGNLWEKPDGTGFSQIYVDLDGDGIANFPYNINGSEVDYLPLVSVSGQHYLVIPVADFSFNFAQNLAPLPVQFTDLSKNVVFWSWDFDNDGTSDSTEQNPTYVYTNAGNYTINLTVSNGKDKASKNLEIIVQEAKAPPVVDFSADVISGQVPLSVQFADLSENETARSWDFDNDGIDDSTEKTPVYVYTYPGIYTANLSASNKKGNASKSVTITVSPAQRIDGNLTLTEFQITKNKSDQESPVIYEDRIVWTELRSKESSNENLRDIYLYNLSTHKETQIATSRSTVFPSIYGDKIVWYDNRSGNLDIYMYDISTQKETQISHSGTARNPKIYGDKIVWLDSRYAVDKNKFPFTNVYMYDLTTHTETQITTSASAAFPAIYGDRIVWQDGRTGNNSYIYMYDLSTHKETRISTKGPTVSPDIYGDKIVWSDGRSGNSSIYMYDLSTSKETRITGNNSIQWNPTIYGDRIVWQDQRNGDWDIYMYDLSTSRETRITNNYSAPSTPVIYRDRIVWMDTRYGNYDIYMCTVENNVENKGSISDSGTNEDSSGDGSSDGSGHSSGSSGGGAGVSPEPAINVEAREIAQAFITSGNSVKFDFTKNATPVLYVSLDAKKTAGKITTIIEMLKGKSILVSSPPSDEVYKSLNIWIGSNGFASSKNIENAVVCFKVEKSWIQDKHIDQSSITLSRYSDIKWEQLPTNLSGEDNKYLYFITKTPEFSPFAITGKATSKGVVSEKPSKPNSQGFEQKNGITASGMKQQYVNKENTSTPENENRSTTGFLMIYAVTCLLCVYLYKRK